MGGIKKRPSEKKGQVFFFLKGVRVNSKRKNRAGAHQKKMGFAEKKKKGGKWAHKKMKKNAHFFLRAFSKKKRRDFPIFWTSNFWPPSSYIA